MLRLNRFLSCTAALPIGIRYDFGSVDLHILGLMNADPSHGNFSDANAENANLIGVNLTEACLKGANLEGTESDNTDSDTL